MNFEPPKPTNIFKEKKVPKLGLVMHSCDPGYREAEAGGSLEWKSSWYAEGVPGQPARETLSQKSIRYLAVFCYSNEK